MKIIKHSEILSNLTSDKLKKSLLKSGASTVVVDTILNAIKKHMYEGISTERNLPKNAYKRH
jgi:hypothetical protein